MKTEQTESKIQFLVALNKVQGVIEPAKKDSTNPHFKSRYASLASVNEAVMGPLTENGFVLTQGGAEIAGKPYLKTVLYHVSGHSEEFNYPLVVSENPQHTASSVTYARRYSIAALLNLSVEDLDAQDVASAVPQSRAATVPVTRLPVKADVANPNAISEAQARRFYAIWKGAKKTDQQVRAYLLQNYGINVSAQIDRADYEACCKWAESELVEEEVGF